ncbi:calcium-binding protein [Streptomyces sp. NPDC046860]|uniref:calcium-binding protein n=1 Tax=Streptomyces sp. NPDC046860 TaxID=3154495 RepID=UPI0033F1909E
MRIRTSLAVATAAGAVALGAFAVPAAHADETPNAAAKVSSYLKDVKADAAAKAGAKAGRSGVRYVDGDVTIDKVTVNGNQDIVAGTSAVKTVNIYVTATDPSGIYDAYAMLWHGTDIDDPDGVDGYVLPEQEADCDNWSATSATCKLTLKVDPKSDLWDSSLAGKWNVYAGALGNDGDLMDDDAYKNVWIKRAAQITSMNASPEPVKKGKTITATANLSRASWSYLKYYGYGSQSVQLQFAKSGSSTYTTVKTVKTSSTGALKTTATANASGTWRFYFPKNGTTSAATSAGDYVAVN